MSEVKVTKKVTTPTHKITHISVERMGNGYKVHHRKESNETKRVPGGGHIPMPVEQSDPMVFSGSKAAKMAKSHVGSLMDQMGDGLGTGNGDGGGQGGNIAGAAQPAPTTGG